MSDNWVVQNLENALEVWNDKLSEIWQLITQSPQTFKGGSIWSIICSIHGALQAIGYALLVLFFVVGVVKTCGSFAELKKPEHAVKLFVRFAIAKGLITYGMELMMAILEIIQGVVSTIMNSAGFGSPQATVLPQEIITAVEDCGFFESIVPELVPLTTDPSKRKTCRNSDFAAGHFSDIQFPCNGRKRQHIVVQIPRLIRKELLVPFTDQVELAFIGKQILLEHRLLVIDGNACREAAVCGFDIAVAAVDSDYDYIVDHLHSITSISARGPFQAYRARP